MGKDKAPALAVPQRDEDANALLEEYGRVKRSLAALEIEMQAELARAKEKFEDLAKPHKEALSMAFRRLQAWAEANRERLTESGRKSVELPAGRISWRLRPPSIRISAPAEDVIATLELWQLARFIRVRKEIDKEALLKEPDVAKRLPGVRYVEGVEDFAVEPFTADLAEETP